MPESAFYYIDKSGTFAELRSLGDAALAAKNGGFVWLSYFRPEKADLDVLMLPPFSIHPLSIEDCLDEEQVPKLDVGPDYAHILFNTFCYSDGALSIDEMNLFVGDRFIISISRSDVSDHHPLRNIRGFVERDLDNARKGPAYVLHIILDHIVDQKFTAIEVVEDALVVMEDKLMANLDEFDPTGLQQIRRDLLAMRKSLFHEREILVKICRKDIRFIPDNVIFHYNDIYDHLTKFFELTEINRELETSLMQMNLSMLNNRMARSANQTNAQMRRLTFITTIFMPLSLISGIGGMSEWSAITGPENWRVSYPLLIGGMVLLGLGTYLVLKWMGRNDKFIE